MTTDYNKVKPQVNADNIIEENSTQPQFEAITQTSTARPPIRKRVNKFVFGNEGFKGVALGMVNNVFIPVIKRAVLDTGYSVLQRIIYPNGGVSGPTHGGVNYGGYYNSPTTYTNGWGPQYSPTRVVSSPGQPQSYDKAFAKANTAESVFEVQIFRTKQDAEKVFVAMLDAIDRYGRITLGDYLTMCGHRPDAAKWSWGWVDLPTASVLPHIQGGYYIDLPSPRVL